MTDKDGRKIEVMRVSVTNRCNLSCLYCAPLAARQKHMQLSPKQIADICSTGADFGISRIRLTGGEPLMREDFGEIVAQIANIPKVEHIDITTNGILLTDKILDLPINSANISVNATERLLYEKFCGHNNIQTVLINARKAAKKIPVKINCVLLQDSFVEQVAQVISFGEEIGASVRFIELMPMGKGAELKGVATQELMQYMQVNYGEASLCGKLGKGPARYFSFSRLAQPVGFISPMTECFCKECNRIRLLANGNLQPCLAKNHTIDLMQALQNGSLHQRFEDAIKHKEGRHDLQHTTLTALKEIGG